MTASLSTLPALKDFRYLRLFSLALLYVAQGLPIGLFQVAIPAWLASEGLSSGEVGSFIFIAFLPWSFKLLAGPVMDRFSFPPMGRRRPWVLGAQSGIVVVLLVIMLTDPDPGAQFYLMAGLGFLANAFGAMQDVAVDGMAIDILEEDERGRANAFMFGGQLVGTSVSSALGSLALASGGLSLAAFAMATLVALIMLVPLLIRERPGERILPWSEGTASNEALSAQTDQFLAIFGTLFKALILPMSLLLIVLEALNRMAAGLLLAVMPVLTVQELSWEQTDYTQLVALAGVVAAVFGVLMGPVVDRFGATRILTIVVGIRAAMFLLVGLAESLWQQSLFFQTVVMVDRLSGQVVTIAIISLFMRICLPAVSATQFAVYMASANLTLSMGSGLAAPLAFLSSSQMFLVMAGLSAMFLLLWPLLDLGRHERDARSMQEKASQTTIDKSDERSGAAGKRIANPLTETSTQRSTEPFMEPPMATSRKDKE
jgi:MFS transporter, PAT family, beta-lactamase induction signal transducer AmpG